MHVLWLSSLFISYLAPPVSTQSASSVDLSQGGHIHEVHSNMQEFGSHSSVAEK